MEGPLGVLRRLGAGLRALSPRRRNALVAGVCALLVLVVASTLLITFARPSSTAQRIAIEPTSTDTATSTSSPTLTPQPTATHPSSATQPPVVIHAPPPPPVPTAPPATPTIQFCPTPTPLPTATATATPTATATATATASATGSPAAMPRLAPQCQTCPYYKGDNPTQDQIRAALNSAADAYHLPRNLLLAVAWQESRWHEDVLSCDGGIGLMQVQYYTYPWLNQQSISVCGLGATSYDPNTLQGNASLGAKYLAWLYCYYKFWGDNGGTSIANPGAYTAAWYYQGKGLSFPDTSNPSGSLCAAVASDPAHPEYPDMPLSSVQPWSCPYSATKGDLTVLDVVLSAYNEGPGNVSQYGVFNMWYVTGVEGFIPQFYSGALPVPT